MSRCGRGRSVAAAPDREGVTAASGTGQACRGGRSGGCSRRRRSPSSGARGSAGGWWRRTGRWASPGALWPVHPSRSTVAGERAYPRVADLPGVPDAAFVAVPAPACAPVVAELAALGCGGRGRLQLGLRRDRPGGRGTAAGARRRGRRRCRCSGRTATGWSTTPTRVLIWPDQHGGVALAAGRAGRRRGVPVVVDRDQRDDGRQRAAAGPRGHRRQRRPARRGGRGRGPAGRRSGSRRSG